MKTLGVVGMLQLAGMLMSIALVLLRPQFMAGAFGRVEAYLAWLAESRPRQIWFVGLACLILRAALLPLFPPPPPLVADEFSLIFQAKLLLSGRFAVAADPMWRHFEEMHVIAQPVYASIYFPSRSLLPALGLLFGHPWIGAWLGMGLLCAAITWMLQAFVRAPYALVGGLATVLHLGIFSYWANGTWGGTITALGATLVCGAIPRLLAAPRWRDGLLAGLGTLLMMTSRPFDSLSFCLGIAVGLLPWLVRSLRSGALRPVVRLVVPVTLFAALGASIVMAHSAAITGNPLKTAYELNRGQYAITPATLLSAPLPTPQWPDAHMERLYRLEGDQYGNRHSAARLAGMMWRRLVRLPAFYVGPALILPFLLGLLLLLRTRSWLLPPAVLVTGTYLITSWDFPHYASQLLPIAMAAVALGLEALRRLPDRYLPVGIGLSRLLPLFLLLNLVVPLSWAATGWPITTPNSYSLPCCAVTADTEQQTLERRLQRLPGADLVFVRYGPRAPRYQHWVFNEPDYARAPIIWARYRNAQENRAFAARFPGRRVWLLDPFGPGEGLYSR